MAEKLTPEEREFRRLGDDVMQKAIEFLQSKGVPDAMILDRMGTYFTVHACALSGSEYTASLLRKIADQVAAGAFDHITNTDPRH